MCTQYTRIIKCAQQDEATVTCLDNFLIFVIVENCNEHTHTRTNYDRVKQFVSVQNVTVLLYYTIIYRNAKFLYASKTN